MLPANRVAAIVGVLSGLAALVAGIAQVLPGTWPNYALAASGLLTKLVVVVKFLGGSQHFDKLELDRFLAVVKATGDIPGLSQGIKADGFQPPPDEPVVAQPVPEQTSQPAQQQPSPVAPWTGPVAPTP